MTITIVFSATSAARASRFFLSWIALFPQELFGSG
jgi:hypothetical protein